MTTSVRTKSNVSLYPSNIEPRPTHQPHIDPGNYPTQAQQALSRIEPHGPVVDRPVKTEKENMLEGSPYKPHEDQQLMRERDRCKVALYHFNNACNPVNGIGVEERIRLLKDVLIPPGEPRPDTKSPEHVVPLGPGAKVEAPFNCHYGYNITIGEDVLISENCFFVDDCKITIGAHTFIGSNVTILTSMALGTMQERRGSKSRYQGREVKIAEDCYICHGSTILPGVSLGRGAYVAPHEVVRSHILPYGFQGIKPDFP